MCEICGQIIGHLPGCPEATEEDAVLKCDCCGEPIYQGEDYYVDVDEYGDTFCENCFESWASKRRKEA